MSEITQLHRELVARVLEGDGKGAPELRRAAFDNAGLGEPIQSLIDKVAGHSYQVTDEDVAAVRAAGLSEDQIFEIVVPRDPPSARRPGSTRAHSRPWPALWKESLDSEARHPRPRSSPAHQGGNDTHSGVFRPPSGRRGEAGVLPPAFLRRRPAHPRSDARPNRTGRSVIASSWPPMYPRQMSAPFASRRTPATSTMRYAERRESRCHASGFGDGADRRAAPCNAAHARQTHPRERHPGLTHVLAALVSSVSVEQIKDALAVSLAFNITDRLANAFGFTIPSPEATNAGARFLLKRGYR